MKYIDAPGAMQDALYFFAHYFNENMFRSMTAPFTQNLDNPWRFYQELKSRGIEIPGYLHVFFYYNGVNPTFMGNLCSKISCAKSDINDIIAEINSPAFRQKLLRYYFAEKEWRFTYIDLEQDDPQFTVSYDDFENSGLPDDIKQKLSYVLWNFDRVCADLKRCIDQAYHAVYMLRIKYRELIERQVKNCLDTEDMIHSIATDFHTRINPDECSLTVMLIYPLSIQVSGDPVTHICAGLYAREFMELNYAYRHVSIPTFAKIFADESRIKILQMLLENKDVCANDLVEYVGLPQSTIHYHIDMLASNMVIRIARKYQKRIYYALNPDYFFNVQDRIAEILLKMAASNEGINTDRIRKSAAKTGGKKKPPVPNQEF